MLFLRCYFAHLLNNYKFNMLMITPYYMKIRSTNIEIRNNTKILMIEIIKQFNNY